MLETAGSRASSRFPEIRGHVLLQPASALEAADAAAVAALSPEFIHALVGLIPDYALWPAGGFCDTSVFYRKLD